MRQWQPLDVSRAQVPCCDRTKVGNMVRAVQHGREDLSYAMLWLVSYLFLLRLPSEAILLHVVCYALHAPTCVSFLLGQALPICKMSPKSEAAACEQSILWKEGDEICLRLARRKNRPNGSGAMRRKCSCSGGSSTCAVHMLWDGYFALLEDGAKPWLHISAGTARTHLRQTLQRLDVPDASQYGTHDFRRGHAEA